MDNKIVYIDDKTISAKIQASVHLLIPFFIHNSTKFRMNMLRSKEWNDTQLETCFYLQYAKTIFCSEKSKKDENSLVSRCLVMENCSHKAKLTVRRHEVEHEKTRIFCFDTSVGLLDLYLSFSCESMEDIADICARLRQTELRYRIQMLDPCSNTYGNADKTTLYRVANQLISPLGKITMYDHVGSCGKHRAELLASVVVDASDVEDLDSSMFRIAEGIDMRSEESICPVSPYCPLPHIHWVITRKGACNVGLLTDNKLNQQFVLSQWRNVVSNRHILWYVMVLHQKFAIYHYLNDIAKKRRPSDLKVFQKKIMAFNTKYRFEVIAEEPAYQIPYEITREAKSVEQVFLDIDEEIQRIHTYYDTVRDKNTSVAMTIVSLVCAISTFIDIFSLSLLEQPLFDSIFDLSVSQVLLFAVTFGAMIVALSYLVFKPVLIKIAGWIKDFVCWLWRIMFICSKK